MPPNCRSLTEEQLEHFYQKGHIVLKDCFSRDFAQDWIDKAYKRLGYAPDDPATWQEARVHLPSTERVPVHQLAPKAYDAICDLLGGPERFNTPHWGDGFIVNFGLRADEPWQPPSAAAPGWHKDGDFFRHFLDSPEQGLLTIVVWSDILPQSGGTFIAQDSVPPIARLLVAHSEGLLPSGGFGQQIEHCSDFVELTGRTGDVVLIHPYVLHAASNNPSGRPRFITNPPVGLKEPMDFNRADPDDFSPVERAVLRALDVERLDFAPTAPRQRLVPERVKRQKKMLEEQQARLAQAQ